MPVPTIVGFLFDEDNEAKFDQHGLSIWNVQQTLELHHVIVRNRKGRRASHLVVGRDRGGRCIAIPVEPTYDPELWRPVTAWICKDAEEALLRRGR